MDEDVSNDDIQNLVGNALNFVNDRYEDRPDHIIHELKPDIEANGLTHDGIV